MYKDSELGAILGKWLLIGLKSPQYVGMAFPVARAQHPYLDPKKYFLYQIHLPESLVKYLIYGYLDPLCM